jgi:hypothetical protein
MVDNSDPPRPQRKPSGNSAEALRALLERHGLHELLAEVDRRRGLTLFGACCEAGLRKRPEAAGIRLNMARTRAFYFNKALRESERKEAEWSTEQRDNGAVAPDRHAPRPLAARTPRTTLPDLAAAIAEWEEAQRPAPYLSVSSVHDTAPRVFLPRERDVELERELVRERKPAPAVLPPEPVFLAHPALPCTRCQRPEAAAALREVVDFYVCAVRGEPHRTGSVLPGACCQRRLLGRLDVKALVA